MSGALRCSRLASVLLTGLGCRAKRVGTLVRKQRERDDVALREKMGELVVAVEEVEEDEQVKREASLVLTTLKASPGSSGKHKQIKTYVPLKKGDARLWQH